MANKEVKRRAYTSHLTRAINTLNEQLTEDTPDEQKITALIEAVQLKFKKVEDIADILQNDMEETALEADIEKMDALENQVIEVKVKARATLENIHKKPDEEVVLKKEGMVIQQVQTLAAKLPDATLQEFHGDEESFPSFIDNFSALVDSNPYLPDVEKFSYLRGVVKVDVINHFPLTAENYKFALDKLKRVYGDENLIATKHLNALLDMSKRKKPANNKELQEFYNFLETKLTCLEALKRPVEQTNQMLITLIYRQLPKKLKTKVAKLTPTQNTVNAVLDIINEHIRTTKQMDYREASDSDSNDDTYMNDYRKREANLQKQSRATLYENDQDRYEDNLPTSSAAALPIVSQRATQCVYCQGTHSPLHCHKIVDIYQRREIVRRSNRCYNCLKPGHRQSECRSPGACRNCQFKHHTSLCAQKRQYNPVQQRGAGTVQSTQPGNPTNNTNYQGLTTATAWESTGSVLLQMAEAEIRKPLGVKYITGKIFLDSGSQMSYCTNKVKEELDLDILGNDVLELNTFGRTESDITPSDIVTLQIVKGSFSKNITVHTTDFICGALPSFKISNKKLQEFGSIKLANPRCRYEGSHEINILIGADLYWEFVGTDSITTSFGARAVNSKLGWVLSGRVADTPGRNTAINLIHHVGTKQLKTMELDRLSVNKEWINKELPQMKQSSYVNKLHTVCEKPTAEFMRKTKQVENKITTSTLLSSVVIRDTYNKRNQNGTDYEEIEVVKDIFNYNLQNAISNSEIDLSWFWETEHVGILPEEQEPSILQQFEKTIKFVEEIKRYEVEFPCKTKLLEVLPDNYHICEIRLQSLLTKLNKPSNEQLLKNYDEILKKQEQEGIIEEVNLDTVNDAVIHYLPHHGVIRDDKPSSAVRVVYDGSAKSHKKSVSLNQCLHAGPSLVNNLASVLIRFRMFKVVLVADIRKAFLQISLTAEDRDVTRFLWREDGKMTNPLKVYRFTRVPFGLTSSPFLLHATIIHHLNKYKDKYPLTVSKLLEAFYVDDMLTGAETEEEAVQLVEEGDLIMKEANMELTKWNTNSSYLFDIIKTLNADLPSKETSFKLLGLMWNKNSDEFTYDPEDIIKLTETLKPTKRTVLKIVSKVYDPLGPLSPFLITAKVLLQRLSKLKLAWDELLPDEMMKEWKSWVGGLHSLHNLRIPRCINKHHKSCMELIGFCDASKSAYAAVIYLRCYTNQQVNTNFVMARSRVAPMKLLTIPRLELLGAVLLARLLSSVLGFLSHLKFSRITYYTDSMNVLYWIQGTKTWNTYISKRLDEINTLSSKTQWYHCPGEDNPADLPTRGMTIEQMCTSQDWFNGPRWLSELAFQPNWLDCQPVPSQECLKEERKVIHAHMVAETKGIDKVIPLEKYSFRKMCRITAYVLLFIKLHVENKKVSHRDMQIEAEKKWIRNEQRKHYSAQIPYLKGEASKPAGSVSRQLDLFIDKEDQIRCAGRYKYSSLSYRQKYPILLPKDSHLTTLIIEDRHRRVKHAGVKITLTDVREDYWIPRGRRMVQNIVRRCIICRRLSAKPFKAPGPPPLPQIRLSDMPPFTNTGVDFAGPLFCRERGCNEAYKSYISLYTCASTRAISLELVPDLTAHSFKNSMIRFVSNRGIPNVMISDNAKTFKKAAEDLNCLITRSPTQEFIEDNRITWLFYLEKSPWWGGFIERMVGSVKSILRKALYRTFMSYDEMTTLLKQIESIINSRPITYLYDDDIEEPLTPSHLLIGKRSTQLPTASNTTYDSEGRNMYREKMLAQFERRWKKEYLSELQDYHISIQKSKGVRIIPKVGEVVIMKEDFPRGSWKLARVVQLHKAKDGEIRSVEVIKPNRKLARRPPQLLVPLEMKHM